MWRLNTIITSMSCPYIFMIQRLHSLRSNKEWRNLGKKLNFSLLVVHTPMSEVKVNKGVFCESMKTAIKGDQENTGEKLVVVNNIAVDKRALTDVCSILVQMVSASAFGTW